MRGPRGEAVLFGTANPENEADGAGSGRPEGKTPVLGYYDFMRITAFCE